MSVELPNPRNTTIPQIPAFKSVDEVHKYLVDLKNVLDRNFSEQFDNTYTIVNTGTSGTFKSSAGDTITIDSGIVTGLA